MARGATIRVDIIADYGQINGLIEFYEQYPERVTQAVAQSWESEVEIDLVAELLFTPGPSKNSLNSGEPFLWSHNPAKDAKARGWWFANLRQGNVGGGRTGALQDAYEVLITFGDNSVAMVVRNTAKFYKWVKGRYQIPGHARTGWPKDKTIIDHYAGVAREVARRALFNLLHGTK